MKIRKVDNTYKCKYFEFTPKWSGFHLEYQLSGYFDTKPVLMIYFIWGKLFLYLPWKHYKKVKVEKTLTEKRYDKLISIKNKKYKVKDKFIKQEYDECEPPTYGIYIFMNQFGIHYGRKVKLYDFPWTYEWTRTSALAKDGTWLHETRKNNNMNFWDINKWKDILFSESHPYSFITKKGEVQNCIATIRVEEREWRWKWFSWLGFPRKIRKDIEVDFSDDIGEKKGTWKGGTTGCSYTMLKQETPFETLKRMERDRKF